MFRILLAALAVPALALSSPAQSMFYVDAANGSDGNQGTSPSFAFKSLTKASQVVGKNSTIFVMPGTYGVQTTNEAFPVTFGAGMDQSNVTLIGIEGPSKTFIDGGKSSTSLGMLRVRSQGTGIRITGFTFQNMASAFWSMAIRLGSASGGVYSASKVEIDNCVFKDLNRGIVVFGSPANTLQSTDNKIHDNLFLRSGTGYPAVAIYGDGTNHFYNNTIYTTTSGGDGIFLDSIVATAPCKARIHNNIIMNANAVGINVGAAGGAAVIQYNDSYNNGTAFKGFTVHMSNMTVDPMFVDPSKDDFRLKPASKMVDAGTSLVALMRHDLDYFPHWYDYNGNGRAPDIGAYELHKMNFEVTDPLKLGKTAKFTFAGTPNGVGIVLWSLDELRVPVASPLGLVLLDVSTFLPMTIVTTAPGSRTFSVPNDKKLEGLRVTVQGLYLLNGKLELLNVREQVL